MDFLTFVVSMTQAVAWPATCCFMLWLLHEKIAELFSELSRRLRTAKGGGFELAFGEKVDEVERSLPPSERERVTGSDTQEIDERSRLAQLPPAYVVTQAWLRVEEELRRIIGYPAAQSLPTLTLLRSARNRQLISDDELSALQDLRNLRNSATHLRDPNISSTDALRYNDLAQSIVNGLRRHKRQNSGEATQNFKTQ